MLGRSCRSGSSGGRAVSAFEVAVDRGGRQAVLVVACAVFQIAFQFVIFLRKFHALREDSGIFKKRDRHLENRVLHGLCARAGFEFAGEFHALSLVDAERCRRGAAVGYVCGIDVPAGIGLTRKHNIYLRGTHFFVSHAKLHLRLRHAGTQGKQQE